MKLKVLALSLCAALLLSSCGSWKNTGYGTAIGTAAGAAIGLGIGHLAGNKTVGTAVGAAVGAGTSVVDFVNDINRDGFQGKDAWNLVKNLGMDALGVVPVIGDTFGTLGKVKKGLLKDNVFL